MASRSAAFKDFAYRPAFAFLSRSALKNNVDYLQKQIVMRPRLHNSRAEIMAMVKANAYGHDVAAIIPELRSLGIRFFAVASLEEGLEARRLAPSAEILVLGGVLHWKRETLALAKRHRFHIAANDLETLKVALKTAGLRVHLKLDTGMNRLGIKTHEWSEAVRLCKRSPKNFVGLFTHFATAQDAVFLRQARLFEEATRWIWAEGLEPCYVHSENSAALLGRYTLPKGLLSEVGNLVRPGISLYGYSPRGIAQDHSLQPVLELESEIGLIKRVETAEGISYGHLYRAEQPHRFGIVTLGYADGLSKAYSKVVEPQLRSASGRVKGSLKVCGAICMDMVMVRPVKREKLVEGDRVVFWGRFANPILKKALVEPYELNLRISKRIPRVWIP